MVRRLYPVKNNGLIDLDEIFKWVVYRFKIPFSQYEEFIQEYSFVEFHLLLEAHTEDKKDYFENIATATKIGFYNANTGKNVKMFEDNKKEIQTTHEDKQATLEYLNEIFDWRGECHFIVILPFFLTNFQIEGIEVR